MGRMVPTRFAAAAVGLAVGLLTVVASASVAEAHAEVIETVPVDGATVAEVSKIIVRFAEAVETAGAHVWLEAARGTTALASPVHVAGDRSVVEVAVPQLQAGAYTARLHLVAADGDVVAVAFAFTLGAPVGHAPLAVGSDRTAAHVDHPGELPAGIARVVLDAALASLIGGVAFVATVWPQGSRVAATRRLLWAAVLAAGVASLALVVVQRSAASDTGLLDALRPQQIVDSLRFRFGRIAAFRVVLLAAAALLTGRLHAQGSPVVPSRQWISAAVAVAVGLFETIVLLGHESGDALSVASRVVHALGVSLWLGGLVMLVVVVLPRRRPDELAEVLPRFSKLATGAVGLVLVGGVALALQLAGAPEALPTTSYGRALVVKVAVVAGLLIAASRSRRHVQRRIATAGRAALGPIAAVVGVELALIACVLATTAVLLAQAPPR